MCCFELVVLNILNSETILFYWILDTTRKRLLSITLTFLLFLTIVSEILQGVLPVRSFIFCRGWVSKVGVRYRMEGYLTSMIYWYGIKLRCG